MAKCAIVLFYYSFFINNHRLQSKKIKNLSNVIK